MPAGASVADPARQRSVWADREFRGLWLAWAVTLAGDQLARVAVTVLLFTATGSAVWAAAGYAVTMLPALLGGPLLSGLADRRPRRQVMVGCDVVCAVLTAAMAVQGGPVGVAAGLLFVVTLLNSPFTAARSALIRDVFGDDRYTTAVGVNTFTTRGALVAGSAVGGVLVAAVGAREALLIDAATFALSALLVRVTVRHRRAARTHGTDGGGAAAAPGWWVDLVAGTRLVFGDQRLRRLTLYAWLAAFHVAPLGVVVPYAAGHGGGPVAVGLLLAAQAAGVGIGMTILAARVRPERRTRWIAPLSVLASAPLLATAANPGLTAAAVLWAVAGAGSAYQLAANVAFVTAVPNAHRAQAFGLVATGLAAGQGAGLLAAAALADHIGPGPAVAVLGAAGTLAALALLPGGVIAADRQAP
jgi:MFS family permease